MNPKYISITLCSFIFGVGVGSVLDISNAIILTFVVVGILFSIIVFVISKNIGLTILCFIIGSVIGVCYINNSFVDNEYNQYLNQYIDSEGIVASDPVNETGLSGKGQQLTLQPDGFSQLIRTSLYTAIPDVKQGDRVWIRGQIELPDNFSEFDYVKYLQRYEVYAVLKKPKVIVLHRASQSWRDPLLSIRRYVVKATKVYPQKEGGLILGILIGQQQGIPDDVKGFFKRTGLTHIVAVSGFNMTIIATAFGALVAYLGRRMTNIFTIVVVIAFTVITGVTASVVRAAIMAILMVVAQLLGRQYASLHALLIVCTLMVLQNPRIVIWDIGFQLSVAATFGVLIAFKIRNPDSKETFLSDILRPTLGAIFITAPIIAIHFQTISLIAPIANIVVLPFVSWIMLFGALALVPIIGGAFVYPAQLLTSLVISLTQKFASIPHASVDLVLPLWLWGIYYFIVFIYIYFATKPRLPKPENGDKL